MEKKPLLHCRVEESTDEHNQKRTTVKCHGRLVMQNAGEIHDLVKPMIVPGAHILIDLTDLGYVDSVGLGALVGLKVSSITKTNCTLELINITPRVRQILSVTNLLRILATK